MQRANSAGAAVSSHLARNRRDRPASPLNYAALDVLAAVAAITPGPFRRKARDTVADLVRPGDAVLWRLDQPRPTR